MPYNFAISIVSLFHKTLMSNNYINNIQVSHLISECFEVTYRIIMSRLTCKTLAINPIIFSLFSKF
jgi:hypothetical protein